jgi:Flp pilus assembly protein CpaB
MQKHSNSLQKANLPVLYSGREGMRFNLGGGSGQGSQGRFHIPIKGRNLRLILAIGAGCVAIMSLTTAFMIGSSKNIAKETPVTVESSLEQLSSASKPIQVLVPVRAIERGEKLERSVFISVPRPANEVESDTAKNFEQVNGAYAQALIPSMQPFSMKVISSAPPLNTVIRSIPRGARAISIGVNETSAVEGWARAGEFVDVHWISTVTGEQSAALLVENAKILSAERQADPNAPATAVLPTTVTLLTSERDAQKLALASTSGSLVLHLRGSEDGGKVNRAHGVINKRDLLQGSQRGNKDTLQGFVRFKDNSGKTKEFAIVNGEIMNSQEGER